MFLDANMSNQVEQKLKDNFPNSIKREIFKVTSIFKPNKSISKKHVIILILVTMTKTHTENTQNGFVIMFVSNNASLIDLLNNHRLLLRIAVISTN